MAYNVAGGTKSARPLDL